MLYLFLIKDLYCVVLGVIVLVATCNIMQAQRLSPLFQYMNSNTIIERTEEFRDMQFAIESETGSTKPGINADIFYKKISLLKNDLLNGTKITFELKANDIICSINIAGTNTMPISLNAKSNLNNKSMRLFYDTLESSIENSLSRISTKLLGSFGEQSKSAMVKALIIALKEQSLLKRIEMDESKIEHILARLITEQVKEVIENTVKLSDENTVFDFISTALINKMYEVSEDINNMFRDRLLKAFVMAEDILYETIKSFSSILISANSGIGITEGKGMFNGGVHISWNAHKNIQGGIYLNGEISREDSTEPSRSLFGIQARYTTGIMQFDILASYLFGDKNFNIDRNNSSYEFGLGIGMLVRKSVIGAAITARKSYGSISDESISWVITYRAASPDSPILMFGFARTVPQEFIPVFNISLPVR